jgi:hypothetical protein
MTKLDLKILFASLILEILFQPRLKLKFDGSFHFFSSVCFSYKLKNLSWMMRSTVHQKHVYSWRHMPYKLNMETIMQMSTNQAACAMIRFYLRESSNSTKCHEWNGKEKYSIGTKSVKVLLGKHKKRTSFLFPSFECLWPTLICIGKYPACELFVGY